MPADGPAKRGPPHAALLDIQPWADQAAPEPASCGALAAFICCMHCQQHMVGMLRHFNTIVHSMDEHTVVESADITRSMIDLQRDMSSADH